MSTIVTNSGGTRPAGMLPIDAFGGKVTSYTSSLIEIRTEEYRDPADDVLKFRKRIVDTKGTISLTVTTATVPKFGDVPADASLDFLLGGTSGSGHGYKVDNVSETGTTNGVPNYNLTLRWYPA